MELRRISAAAALLYCTIASCPAHAGDVYVICNNGLALTDDDVRDTFLGDKQLAGSVKLQPVDNAAAQKDMLEKILKIDLAKYTGIWTKKGFRDGLNPPPVKATDAEVIAMVKANPGGVGYVTGKPDGVKVLHKY